MSTGGTPSFKGTQTIINFLKQKKNTKFIKTYIKE
jgi:hypothetical protein